MHIAAEKCFLKSPPAFFFLTVTVFFERLKAPLLISAQFKIAAHFYITRANTRT